MARPKTPDMEKRIIDAAAVTFARKGFSGTLMTDIAAAAGIGKGTIYQYYKSKDELFFAVFRWLTEQFEGELSAQLARLQGTAASRLKQCAHLTIASWLEMLDSYTLVFEFWSAAASSARKERFRAVFNASYRQYRSMVLGLLQEGADAGEFSPEADLEAAAAALAGAWDALLLQRWLDAAFEPLAVCDQFMDIVLEGLKKK